MRFLKGGIRFLLVTVGIIALTSFTIDATDSFSRSQTALSLFAGSVVDEECPVGTSRIDLSDKSICVDMYENSVGSECKISNPTSNIETKTNIDKYTCQSVSEKDLRPWVFVSLHQAKQLCAKRDMRLPSALEWYEAGLGTPDTEACNTEGNMNMAGVNHECRSSRGVYDMIGNVWEWVDETVQDGMYQGHALPSGGYVSEIDAAGVPLITSSVGDDLYNSDYYWGSSDGVHAMMRGGFYNAETDAGLFSVHTGVLPSFSSVATGFRCVKSI